MTIELCLIPLYILGCDPDTSGQVEERASQLLSLFFSEASYTTIPIDTVHLMVKPR